MTVATSQFLWGVDQTARWAHSYYIGHLIHLTPEPVLLVYYFRYHVLRLIKL